MTQPELTELMRQIADAMERNPDGWWKEFCYEGEYEPQISFLWPTALFAALAADTMVYKKPQTYTLHVEDMPEPLREPPEMGFFYWLASIGKDAGVLPLTWCGDALDYARLRAGLCYPNKSTASTALRKLEQAMGGGA